jgi:hypothetical protein
MHKTIPFLCFLILFVANTAAYTKANTAQTKLSIRDLNLHGREFLNSKANLSLYPELLRVESQTILADKNLPTLLLIYKAYEPKNKKEVASFLNLWLRHKDQFNFVLIDLDKPLTYISTLLLREYWKQESLKVLALSPSGKIKIQLEEPTDLQKLDSDLNKLVADAQNTKVK